MKVNILNTQFIIVATRSGSALVMRNIWRPYGTFLTAVCQCKECQVV